MNSTPTSGRKMTRERTGQSLIMTSGSEGQVPAHQGDHPNQHREGVVIDVPGLQPPGACRQAAGQRRYPVRPQAVDDGAVAALPERSEEHTSELQSLLRNSYAVFCLKNKKK